MPDRQNLLYLATISVRVPIIVDGPFVLGTATPEPRHMDVNEHAEHVAEQFAQYLYVAFERAMADGSGVGDGRVIGMDAGVENVTRMEVAP